MNLSRGIALLALVAAIAVVAYVLLRGGGQHEYNVVFENAGQLVKDDDVQVGGRRIGSVREISLTKDNQAKVKIAVDNAYAPLREGTTALTPQTSLSAAATRSITLGMTPNNAKALPAAPTICSENTTAPFDLDQ